MDRITPGIVAMLVGSLLAIVLFVPLVAVSYRRHGGMTTMRSLGWAALLFWVLGLLAYTLLPLPNPDAIRCTTPQLVLGASLDDIAARGLVEESLLANPAFQQVLLNVVLFLPLGGLLRIWFGQPVWVAALLGFGLSLLVETTQLTGVWGLYPCAYRHFDVDDLVTNTAGAILGWAIAWAVTLGRTRDTRPTAVAGVTRRRRVIGMVSDVLVAELFSFVLVGLGWFALVELAGLPLERADDWVSVAIGSAVALVLQAAVLLPTGATIGEHAVLLRGVVPAGRPVVRARLVRLFAGIGGYLALGALPSPADLVQVVFVVVTIAWLWRDGSRRGLAAHLAGMDLEDTRPHVA